MRVHPGLAIRRQPHHLPLVAVALKSQVGRELAVEESHRIGKWNGQNVLQAAVAAVPNRCGLPRAPAIHHHDGSIFEPGESVSADGMSQMVIHKSHASLGLTEMLRESPGA